MIWYTLTARFRYREQRKAASAMNSLLLDNLQGVRQIKSYAREETELERFSASARLVGETQLVIMRTWSWYSSAMAFFGALGSAIVLYVGGRDVLAGTMKIGDLVTFFLFVAHVLRAGREPAPDQPALPGGPRLERARGGNPRCGARKITASRPPRPSSRAQGQVEYRNVSFRLPSRRSRAARHQSRR